MKQTRSKNIGITIYIVLLLTPIYWLLNMSFKTNQEILSGLTLWPENFTFANYATIFTDPSWYNGYLNSMLYVSINVVITLLVALPAVTALLIVNLAFGVMSRSAPQLNVFSLGFPFSIVFGAVIMWVALQGWLPQFDRLFSEFVTIVSGWMI